MGKPTCRFHQMPYVLGTYRAPAFQIIGANSDAALNKLISKARAGEASNSYTAKISVEQSFAKVQEYYLTKRELWFFTSELWNRVKANSPTLDFWAQYELKSTTDKIVEKVVQGAGAKVDGLPFFKISVVTFSEDAPMSTKMEITISTFQ